MQQFRVFILLVLAVLPPVRGVVAATMLCPAGVHSKMAAVAAAQGHHHACADAADGDAADDDGTSGERPAGCHFCASGCCMASLVGFVPSLGPAGPASPVTFPALTARIPVFQSGG